MRLKTIGLLALLATLAASAVSYPRMPAYVPVHWDVYGTPNGYATRAAAAAMGPLLVLGLLALFALLTRVDPRARRDEPGDARGREALFAWSLLLIAGLAVGFTAAGAGLVGDLPRMFALAFAGFLVFGGNVMGRVRPNWFAGIRTPWTLSSDEVWRRTHRLAARLMVGAGVLLVPLALALPPAAAHAAAVTLLVGSLAAPAVYSFVLYRRRAAH